MLAYVIIGAGFVMAIILWCLMAMASKGERHLERLEETSGAGVPACGPHPKENPACDKS